MKGGGEKNDKKREREERNKEEWKGNRERKR